MSDLSRYSRSDLETMYDGAKVAIDATGAEIAAALARAERAEAERDVYRERMMQQDIDLARVTAERDAESRERLRYANGVIEMAGQRDAARNRLRDLAAAVRARDKARQVNNKWRSVQTALALDEADETLRACLRAAHEE